LGPTFAGTISANEWRVFAKAATSYVASVAALGVVFSRGSVDAPWVNLLPVVWFIGTLVFMWSLFEPRGYMAGA
jgi:hypothetical protein